MSWGFDTDPEFQRELDWMEEFVATEVAPIEMVLSDSYDVTNPNFVKLVRPLLKPLFPEIPDDHPALGMIALNLAANIFGLGNAATPFGIKAMEELQTLNATEDTATNSMVMLLAVNTASVQLVPPVLLLALMGLQINQLIFAIIITTFLSLLIAIVSAKLLGRLKMFRRTDPGLAASSADSTTDSPKEG